MTEFENFDEKIVEAYREWGSKQPDQDAPALYRVGGESWTVKELVSEIEQKTEFGQGEIDSHRRFALEYPYIGARGVIKMVLGEPLED